MSLGGFFRSIFGIGGDHRGWQNNEPLGSVIEGSTQVSPDLSMQLSAVYACVNLISSTIASLPCDVFLISEDGSRKPDKACSLAMLLGNSPNYNMSPFEFWQAMTRSLLLRGNAYALIGRKRDGSAYSITPLSADQMNVKRNEQTGFVEYHYYNDKNEIQVLDPANVFHWKHLGDGYIGLSTIEYMRGTLTEAASAQSNAVDMFAGGGQVTGIIKPVGILTPQQKADTVRGFSQLRSKGKGILILDRQMEFQQLALTPAQTQLLETRRFSVEEICRWFGVPTGLVGGTGDIEKEEGWFYKSTILPSASQRSRPSRSASPVRPRSTTRCASACRSCTARTTTSARRFTPPSSRTACGRVPTSPVRKAGKWAMPRAWTSTLYRATSCASRTSAG